MMKNIFNYVLYGAAMTLGSIVITKGLEVCGDPYKKAKLKQDLQNIKKHFTEKEEA